MELSVWTNNKSVTLSFDINIKGEIICAAYDPERENTEYFNRLIIEDGHYEFNLPKSPKLLKVLILEVNEGHQKETNKFIVRNVRLGKLSKRQLIIDADTKEFLDFAQQFSLIAGYSKPGNYYSKNRKFLIQYMQAIGKKDDTPCRIHKLTGIIDVSKNWFNTIPIPGRIALLTHEFAHNNLDNEYEIDIDKLSEQEYNEYINKIEKEADENALQLYIGLGYPKVEWIYTWTHIFKGNDSQLDRLRNSDNKLSIM